MTKIEDGENPLEHLEDHIIAAHGRVQVAAAWVNRIIGGVYQSEHAAYDRLLSLCDQVEDHMRDAKQHIRHLRPTGNG